MTDWFGGAGVAARERAERIIAETLRRVKLLAKNDIVVFPPANDLSTILAARSLVLQPLPNPPLPQNLDVVMAARIFLRGAVSSGSGGQRLTFGTHLTGGSYDGSAPVTLATDAVSTNTASTIAARGAAGEFSMGILTATGVVYGVSALASSKISKDATWGLAIVGVTGSSNDLTLFNNAASVVLQVPAGTVNARFAGTLTADSTVIAPALDVISTGGAPAAGQATLVAGTVTVNTTLANSFANGRLVFLTRSAVGGTPGNLSYTTVAGTSITINSDNAADTSTVNWFILKVH